MKKLVTLILVLFALAGAASALYRQAAIRPVVEMNPNPPPGPVAVAETPPPPVPAETMAAPQSVVTVTYFTTRARCGACLRIEDLTRRAVATRYSTETRTGRVAFRTLLVDQPANRHYIQDYQLVSKSVIVAETLDGREESWVNLPDIWLLLGNEQAFMDYVAQAVDAYL